MPSLSRPFSALTWGAWAERLLGRRVCVPRVTAAPPSTLRLGLATAFIPGLPGVVSLSTFLLGMGLSGSLGGLGEGMQAPQERRGALPAGLCPPLTQLVGGLQVPAGRGPRKGHRMATERAGGEQTPICFLPWVEGCPTEPPAAASGVWVL